MVFPKPQEPIHQTDQSGMPRWGRLLDVEELVMNRHFQRKKSNRHFSFRIWHHLESTTRSEWYSNLSTKKANSSHELCPEKDTTLDIELSCRSRSLCSEVSSSRSVIVQAIVLQGTVTAGQLVRDCGCSRHPHTHHVYVHAPANHQWITTDAPFCPMSSATKTARKSGLLWETCAAAMSRANSTICTGHRNPTKKNLVSHLKSLKLLKG